MHRTQLHCSPEYIKLKHIGSGHKLLTACARITEVKAVLVSRPRLVGGISEILVSVPSESRTPCCYLRHQP